MTGRVVLVVGGSSGIGLAVVRQLSTAGDTVVAVSRDPDALHRATGGLAGVTAAAADVLDQPALERVVADVVAEHGRLDAVVHTAQVMAYGRIEDVPATTFERVVETAIHGTANLARAVLPQLRAQSTGTFVIVNSLLGEVATPRMGAYDAAKWGQLGLARVLRLELRDAPGVHLCTVSPGAINTPIYDQAANYAGRGGSPPPPVVAPERVSAAIVRLLDRPRRHVEVGPVNVLTRVGFLLAPAIYERIVGPLVDRFVFAGTASAAHDGNVFTPVGSAEAQHGRWSTWGRARRAGTRS